MFQSWLNFVQPLKFQPPKYTMLQYRMCNPKICHLYTNHHQQDPVAVEMLLLPLRIMTNFYTYRPYLKKNNCVEFWIKISNGVKLIDELTISWLVLPKSPWANTDTTNTFITNETNNAIHASIKKYIFASRTLELSRLFTSRDYRWKRKRMNGIK